MTHLHEPLNHARGWSEGPLGFPMSDRSARAVEALLRRLPTDKEHGYRHLLMTRAPTELNPGERSDVSWISTESVDRTGEVVIAGGMDDSQFRLNPLVTLSHDYNLPPVGRSLWRKRVRDGSLVGIKAKTRYPEAPASWPADAPWMPDRIFALVQAGLLRGKSIGFLPLRVHVPTEQEREKNGWTDGVHLVIDEWLLLEYACVSLPANQDALVEAVSKAMPDTPVGFTTEAALAEAVKRRVNPKTVVERVRRVVREVLERKAGRV